MNCQLVKRLFWGMTCVDLFKPYATVDPSKCFRDGDSRQQARGSYTRKIAVAAKLNSIGENT